MFSCGSKYNMAEHNSMVKIPVLDGTNFSNWKFRVGVLLAERDLQQFIEEDLDDIVDKADADKRDAIRRSEKKCVSLLVQTIHDSQLEYVKDIGRAKAMYDTLNEVFERKTVTAKYILRKQLLSMKYDETEQIQNHFLVFDTMIRELKGTGVRLDEEDVIVHLLLTLPTSYDGVVTAIETMNAGTLTLNFVKSRLMDEYAKRKGITSEAPTKSTVEASAMNAKNPNIVCFKCGKKGHIKSKCKSKASQKPKSESKPSGEANNAMCAGVTGTRMSEHAHTEALGGACNDQSSNNAMCTSVAGACMSEHARTEALSSACDDTRVKFILDSGATQHMVNRREYFSEIFELEGINIGVAEDGRRLTASRYGNILIQLDGESATTTITNVLLIENLKCNLLSTCSLMEHGHEIIFKDGHAHVSKGGKEKFIARLKGRLNEVTFNIKRNGFAAVADGIASNQQLWHFRYGHLNINDIRKLADQEMAKNIGKLGGATFCEPCVLGKQTRSSFPVNKNARSNRILELIHTDVCSMPCAAHDGSRYFLTFTDDYSRCSMVYCIERKSDVFERFKEFVSMAEAKHGCKVAGVRADNGGEYVSKDFGDFCRARGIQMNFTVPYNPEMNAVAERLNRTLLSKARTMLLTANLDEVFWNEAIMAANYLKNRSPTTAVGDQFKKKTPAELWYGGKPDVSHLRIFGSPCYNLIPSNNRKKMDARSVKCIMMGYTSSIGSYRLWDIERRKVVIGRHVTFNERELLGGGAIIELPSSETAPDVTTEKESTKHELNDSEVFEDAEERADDDEADDHGANQDDTGNIEDDANDADENGALRRGTRRRRPPQYFHDIDFNAHYALSAETFVDDDPKTIREAKERSDWPQWQEAVNSEYNALIENETWSICDLPKDRTAVTCKWVFKLKRSANGEIDKYKARLVARGFSQREGFDYNETYSPVAKLTTLRILLSVANHTRMIIHQMDVKSAFLNGKLNEEIFMMQPEGFRKGNGVLRLNKAIYGLKQASRMWNNSFNDFMLKIGFRRCASDQCLYIDGNKGSTCYVLLYVDDLLIICKEERRIGQVKELLSRRFRMTDIGQVGTFLGMHIEQDVSGGTIKMSQQRYLRNVLKKFDMTDCKPASTPIEKGLQLEKGSPSETSAQPYRELIGCLMYATLTTRPDLCAAVNYFSGFQGCFTDRHYKYAKHILRYVRGSADLRLFYGYHKDAGVLVGYSDADWGGDHNDRKSTSGYVFKVFGNVVSWSSRKQSTISQSSTEAEYVALAQAVNEAKWIRQLLIEIGVAVSQPITIYEDNQSCIRIAEEPREHKRMKHVDIKYCFIRDEIARGIIKVKYKPTGDQTADIMTKGLGRNLFHKHRGGLGLI